MNLIEKEVYDILLTPIRCDKNVSKIINKDGVITSPQLYCRVSDEDMSDFSIGFYKIVYKDILFESNGEILYNDGYYINQEFMGDTMHSFNALANIILKDKSKTHRSTIEKWPKDLFDYYSKYHCLANFWIIPMCHGRRSAKLNSYDSLDYYLYMVKDNFIVSTDGYFGKFTSWENFLATHCISSDILKLNPLVIYDNKDINSCISELHRIEEFWKFRAIKLVNKYGSELYEYFIHLGLI